MSKVLMHIEGLTIGHEGNILFSGVSLDICEGDCIMLCGANGSGKTTLLKSLEKTIRTESDIEAVMIPSRIPKVAGFTLKEFVRISCFRHSDMSGKLSPADERSLEESLKALALEHLSSRDISTLSDGEFQKACIAAALVRKASVILLDEPTAFLDAENRVSVLATLRELSRKRAVIFSTHDLHEGRKAANKVIALGADGKFRISTHEMEKAIHSIFRSQV